MSVAELINNEFKPWANLNFNSLTLNNSYTAGYTGAPINNYEEIALNLVPAGAYTTGTQAFYVRKIGNITTITWPDGPFTATSTNALSFQLPSRFYPLAAVNQVLLVSVNATQGAGYMHIGTNGLVVIYASLTGGSFTNTQANIFYGGCIAYGN